MKYDKVCLEAFLKNQQQLFDEPVAETLEEADDFLQDCMAVVKKDFKQAKRYFKDNMDASGMSDDEIREACELFALPDGRYLIVEG
ncbi:MAG: glyoxalase [Eubacteriales bacterium]|nr:glyoxalase [Eubacteriales bacterium]